MIWLFIFLSIFIWLVLGFIAFLIEAKVENITSFGTAARKEFRYCLGFGLFSLLVMLSEVIFDWFCNQFMDGLLFKLNSKESKKKK